MLRSITFKRLFIRFRKQKINLCYFSTQFDKLTATQYVGTYDSKSSLHWYMKPAEDHAVSYLLNMKNKRDLSVLDVACGIGTYCERAKKLGFGKVMGIDSAPAQIKEAMALNENKNIKYKVVDPLELKNKQYANEFHNKFDVVNASWLFDYAKNKDELIAEMEGLYKCLKNGGIYTGMFINENVKSSAQSEWDEFGLYFAQNKNPGVDIKEGDCVDFHACTGMSLNVYKWRYKTTDELLKNVGFVDIQFLEPPDWDLLNSDKYQWNTDEDRQKFFTYVFKMGNFSECAMIARKPIWTHRH